MVSQFEFTKEAVDTGQLFFEVQRSSIVTALDRIDREDHELTIIFKADLSESDIGTLEGLVEAHTPNPNFTVPIVIVASQDPDSGAAVPTLPYRYAGDGKLRVLASHKPIINGKEAYNFFSSAGDDQETGELAGGQPFMLECTSGTASDSVELRFTNTDWPTEYVYIFGGGICWENAGWGDTVSMEIRTEETPVVPRQYAEGMGLPINYNLDGTRIVYAGPGSGTHALGGYPKWVPNFENTGHWNLDTVNMVAVPASGVGYFDWYIEDTKVGDYVKNLLVYGSNYNYMLIDGTESAPLPYGTYFVATAKNNSNTNWKCWGLMKMYRERLK